MTDLLFTDIPVTPDRTIVLSISGLSGSALIGVR
jgi:hypothetical protein